MVRKPYRARRASENRMKGNRAGRMYRDTAMISWNCLLYLLLHRIIAACESPPPLTAYIDSSFFVHS